jgi:hypothetical protein
MNKDATELARDLYKLLPESIELIFLFHLHFPACPQALADLHDG